MLRGDLFETVSAHWNCNIVSSAIVYFISAPHHSSDKLLALWEVNLIAKYKQWWRWYWWHKMQVLLVAAVIMVIMVHAIYKSYVRQNKYLEENYPLMCSAIWWQSRRPVINAIILTSDLSRCNYQPVMGPIAAIWVGISQNILTYQHQLMEEQTPDPRCGQR